MPDTVSVIGGTRAPRLGLPPPPPPQGVPIVIGSRDAERGAAAAEEARQRLPEGSFEGMGNGEAAERSDIVFLTVPFRSQSETLTNLKNHLREGQILVDATVPLAAAVSG